MVYTDRIYSVPGTRFTTGSIRHGS
jgi:hypothetical protein